MNIKIFLVVVLSLLSIYTYAQNLDLYQKHLYINKGDTLPYRLLLPENYDASKDYPLILFLHGAGERGSDNEKQLVHGSKLFLRDSIRKNYPAIVVFPQCPANSYWSNVEITRNENGKRNFDFKRCGKPTVAMALAINLLDHLQQNYSLSQKQLYIGGLSMGGMGTFEMVRRKPKLFAAAFPICGGANPKTAGKLKKTSWWIFHGLKDDVVDPKFSRVMAEALKQKRADVKLTLYPDANHNSWDPAFAEKDLLPWLFSKHK